MSIDDCDVQLDILRSQIRNFESDQRKVNPDEVKLIFDKVLRDRTLHDYQQIQKYLWDCNLFVTIRNAKVISEAAILDLIKQLRFQPISGRGKTVYTYGSMSAAHNSSNPKDMEAFIVVKGRVGIKAPRLVNGVT
jgi:hypothetical protein